MRPARPLLYFFVILILAGAGCSARQNEAGGDELSRKGYANMDQLVADICRDARMEFKGFYLSTDISVKPFQVISNYYVPESTLLGVTLADQMTAGLSRLSTMSWSRKVFTGIFAGVDQFDPEIRGLIEELDGYLRIHISGRNAFGEKRSFVVSAEMSEPLYRALHTRVKTYGL